MNPSEKESVMEEINTEMVKKCCADCKTTKTPLWRGGPAGPKSLCNACGIRYRKKRSAMVGLNSGPDKRKDKPATNIAAAKKARSGGGGGGNGGGLSKDLRVRLMALGKEMVMLQRQRSPVKKRQRSSSTSSEKKLGEEEQAAVLLMALSCGSVFA